MQSYVLGIDIGTGSIKTVAVDETANVFPGLQRYYETINSEPGYSEQDPAVIVNAFLNIIKDTVQKIGHAPLLVSLSSAMHSVVPVDENGTALSGLMLWSDTRSASIAIEIKKLTEAEQVYRDTGTPIHSMSPLCKIAWLRKNQSSLFERTHKFISIKEYIWYQLFHEFKIDHSLASGTGLFNIHQLKWNPLSLK
ncbi:MAG: FGGY family carbohydrate kinase, partial [Flavisolibacter sp.]